MGHESRESVDTPREVEHLSHERIANGAAGAFHSLCVTTSGELYFWGAHYERDTLPAVVFGTGTLSAYKRAMIEKSHLAYLSADSSPPSSSDGEASQADDREEPTSSAGALHMARGGVDSIFKRVVYAIPRRIVLGDPRTRVRTVRRLPTAPCFFPRAAWG